MRDLPIILLPGLNGDPRVFQAQVKALPGIRVAQWLRPVGSETLASYAARMARHLDPGGPCIIGGVSFGGIVAMEVSHHLQARACVVIGSSRDVLGLPRAIRLLRSISGLVHPHVTSFLSRRMRDATGSVAPRLRKRLKRLSPEELRFRQWALQALLRWKPSVSREGCRIAQIHGERDAVFAVRRSKANVIVPGAGHLLTLTHAMQVNEFIEAVRDQFVA